MAQIRERQLLEAPPDEATLLRLAAARLAEAGTPLNLDVPNLWLKYGEEVDLLTIRFIEHPCPNRCTSNLDAGVLYNYEDENLVSVEILDITERYC